MTNALILKNRRKLNNYGPKTLFIKASWPISYTSLHNQCLNIDVQVKTCMTMNLIEERERSMTVDIISQSISVGQGCCEIEETLIQAQSVKASYAQSVRSLPSSLTEPSLPLSRFVSGKDRNRTRKKTQKKAACKRTRK